MEFNVCKGGNFSYPVNGQVDEEEPKGICECPDCKSFEFDSTEKLEICVEYGSNSTDLPSNVLWKFEPDSNDPDKVKVTIGGDE